LVVHADLLIGVFKQLLDLAQRPVNLLISLEQVKKLLFILKVMLEVLVLKLIILAVGTLRCGLILLARVLNLLLLSWF
jgi:hypothetical protein